MQIAKLACVGTLICFVRHVDLLECIWELAIQRDTTLTVRSLSTGQSRSL